MMFDAFHVYSYFVPLTILVIFMLFIVIVIIYIS